MKCEKCKEREADFFYTATVNGETTQCRLCADCAGKLGLTPTFERPAFGGQQFGGIDFFGGPFSMLDNFFAPLSALGEITVHRLSPLRTAVAEPAAEPEAEKIPRSAGEELRARRELIELKYQLKAAVREENFERAAELRDKIKSLEDE